MRFPGRKDKAVTLSYDDGAKEDIRLMQIMNRYGLKGTFNLCSGLLKSEPDNRTPISEYAKAGMEVAMHGENHLWLDGANGGEIIKEFYQDKVELERLTGKIMRGGAYAYVKYNEQALSVLKTLGVSYFRQTGAREDFSLPTDWLKWEITCRHIDKRLFDLLDTFLNQEGRGVYKRLPKLFYLMGHSWEFTRDNNWEVIEKFGEMLSSRDDIYFATNIEIYDYVKAYEGLIFSAEGNMVQNLSPIDVYFWIDGKDVLAKANSTTVIKG
jgi:peptidoglycan/xylan/chitin deacetylase (PgdA/CDA1 family)